MKKTILIISIPIIVLIFIFVSGWDIKLYNHKKDLYQDYLAMENELKSYTNVDVKKTKNTNNLLEHFNEIAATFNSMPNQIIWHRKTLPDKLQEKSLEDIFEQNSLATESPQPSN